MKEQLTYQNLMSIHRARQEKGSIMWSVELVT